MNQMQINNILFTPQEIADRVQALGEEITRDYEGPIIMVGVLKGCFIFLSDLSRAVRRDVSISFMEVSSYGDGTVSKGTLSIKKDLDVDIAGKDVLIVEDIIDTGLTLHALRERLLLRQPKSLKICTIFDKPARRRVALKPEYTGFEIPDEFVVGYGLDCAEKYRNLPYLATLAPVEPAEIVHSRKGVVSCVK